MASPEFTPIARTARAIEDVICAGFTDEKRDWARDALCRVLVPCAFDVSYSGDPQQVANALIEALNDPNDEVRYGRLVVAYFQAVLSPLSQEAISLACAAFEDRTDDVASAATELQQVLISLATEMSDAGSAVLETLGTELLDSLLDCAFASAPIPEVSLRMSHVIDARSDTLQPHSARLALEPQLQATALGAWRQLFLSRTAAEAAVEQDRPDAQVLEYVRSHYEQAMSALDQLLQQAGPNALDRISDPTLQAALRVALETRIGRDDWGEGTLDDVIGNRLAIPV